MQIVPSASLKAFQSLVMSVLRILGCSLVHETSKARRRLTVYSAGVSSEFSFVMCDTEDELQTVKHRLLSDTVAECTELMPNLWNGILSFKLRASSGVSSGGPSSSAMVVEDDELNEQVYEHHVLRWREEAACRAMLDDADFVEKMPWHDDSWAQNIELEDVARDYMTKFNHSVIRGWDMEKMPLNPGPWLVEANWCLEELQRRLRMPRCMTRSHDRHIRADASTSADGCNHPRNEILHVYVNVLSEALAVC